MGLTVACLLAGVAHAYLVSIDSGSTLLYLQVGAGNMSGNYNAGGTPGRNTTQNRVSVTVPASAIGTGVAQSMTTDSTVTTSPLDGYAFCSSPSTTGQVYVGGFYRASGTSNKGAVLSVDTLSPLSNGSASIPFDRISWTSSGSGDSSPTIPSGTFAANGSKTLRTIDRNSWFESCLAFRYLNTELVPAGTFTGTATYTLTAQ